MSFDGGFRSCGPKEYESCWKYFAQHSLEFISSSRVDFNLTAKIFSLSDISPSLFEPGFKRDKLKVK